MAAAAAPVLEIVASVVGGLAMAACVVGAVRFVQQRRRRARQAQLGLGADERRFKRRLEQSIAEVDNIFADDDDDDDEDDDEENDGDQGAAGELDGELDDEDREQLKLIEAERSKGSPKRKSTATPARGAGATATPAGGGGDSSVNDEEGAESASLTASSNKR